LYFKLGLLQLFVLSSVSYGIVVGMAGVWVSPAGVRTLQVAG